MARIDWALEAALATGYPVVEVGGWETRGYSDGYAPHVVVTHHTAGPTASGDMPSLGIITNGRSDLPGPLANYAIGRSGTIYVVASGKANNAGEGGWLGYDSNYDTVGIEPENDGKQPWPAAQVDAGQRLEAEILRRLGEPAGNLCGHKEWAPGRKVDPHTINMTTRRAAVAALLEDEMPQFTDEEAAFLKGIVSRAKAVDVAANQIPRGEQFFRSVKGELGLGDVSTDVVADKLVNEVEGPKGDKGDPGPMPSTGTITGGTVTFG